MKLSKTMSGDLDEQIATILKILWATTDDKFYFESYGSDILRRLVKDWVEKDENRTANKGQD